MWMLRRASEVRDPEVRTGQEGASLRRLRTLGYQSGMTLGKDSLLLTPHLHVHLLLSQGRQQGNAMYLSRHLPGIEWGVIEFGLVDPNPLYTLAVILAYVR